MRSEEPARILAVDDEPANLGLLEKLLRRWGYDELCTVTESWRIPGLFAEWSPEILLLDLSMPKPDGIELLEILAPVNDGPVRVPIVVLTADVTSEARQSALAAGATDFLTKPFDADEVRLRLRNMLRTRRLQVELAQTNARL